MISSYEIHVTIPLHDIHGDGLETIVVGYPMSANFLDLNMKLLIKNARILNAAVVK